MKAFLFALPAVTFFILPVAAEVEIQVPDDFSVEVVAPESGRGRHITVRENGDIFVSLSRSAGAQGGVAALRDTTGDGQADRIEYFGEGFGTALEISGSYLYRQREENIERWELPGNGALIPSGPPELIAGGFRPQTSHEAKAMSLDGKGKLWVSVGAPSNNCMEQHRHPGSPGKVPCDELERHAGIWLFDADQQGQQQLDDGQRFATGLRHCVAMDWNPATQSLYVVAHDRDQLGHLWPEHYTAEESAELPPERFHRIQDGFDGGWPYAYWDHRKEQYMVSPEYGGDGKTPETSADYDKPILSFPAHWAPNDLHFYRGTQFPQRYRGGAFVAFHGSWNRAPKPQGGYLVAFVPMGADGNPSGPFEVFATGFAGRDTVASPNDATYRPCGIAEGPDGALYVVDSRKGRVWRISYTPQPEQEK